MGRDNLNNIDPRVVAAIAAALAAMLPSGWRISRIETVEPQKGLWVKAGRREIMEGSLMVMERMRAS